MSTKKKMTAVFTFCCLLLVFSNPTAWLKTALASRLEQSDTPDSLTIPYLGRLNGADDQPVADGNYTFSFNLYNNEAGGQPLWSEIQEGVAVANGGSNITLGSVNPIPATLLDGWDLWLAISLRGPGEAVFTALTPAAAIDRVVHHSIIIEFGKEMSSHRADEAAKRLQETP